MGTDTTGESDSRLGLACDILARALGFGFRSSGPWRPAGRSSSTARPQQPRPGQYIAVPVPRCYRRVARWENGPPILCLSPLVDGRCALHGDRTGTQL